MNTQDNEPNWPDALIDRGLTEILGGETPPDLSERILTAAIATATEPVTLAQGTAAMNTSTIKQRSRFRSWAILAASIACIGTVVGLLLPARNAARHSARSLNNLAQVNQQSLAHIDEQESLRREELKEILTTDGKAEGAGEKDLQMMVTPGIIIAEQEEERLCFVSEDTSGPMSDGEINEVLRRRALSSPSPSRESESFAFQGESSTTAPTPYYSTDDLQDLAEEPPSAPIEHDTGLWSELSTRRKKFAEVDLSHRSQFPHDKLPDNNFMRHLMEQHGYVFPQLGTGPGTSGDKYTRIYENPFITAIGEKAVSTFSIDVDTASYANVRQFLQSGQLPPPDAVRIEELLNYFHYDYAGPTDDTPFAAHMEVAACPWNPEHRLARIAIKGKEIDSQARPLSNLVFLIDVSGSMNEPNKLPLVVEGMKQLTRELGENDKIAIVVYASSEGLALPSTRGDQQQTILAALDRLSAGGSTAGGAGINLAYQVAQENFIKGGVNRVILCTDGDFNVGVTSTGDLERLAEQKAKTGVFLTVLGFGRGNLNDAMMEAISGKGNGNYHYVDNLTEARKVLVEEMSGTLVTIAKDVKIQVEFNPADVAGYRLIGYENRMLRTEDFNDDKKDAGEIGAGHTVTALYEIVPAGKEVGTPSVDPLGSSESREYGREYGRRGGTAKPQAASEELLTLKLRYKLPDADTSTKVEFPITGKGGSFEDASQDFQFAAAVASFGMLLRNSEHKGNATFDAVLETTQQAIGSDPHGYRAEFLELARIAKQLSGARRSSTVAPSTTEGP